VYIDSLSQEFASETRALVRHRITYAAIVVVAAVLAIWCLEHPTGRTENTATSMFPLFQAALLFGAAALCQRPNWKERALVVCSSTFAALALADGVYYVLLGVDRETLVATLVLLIASPVVFLPWGIRGQAPVVVASMVSYFVALAPRLALGHSSLGGFGFAAVGVFAHARARVIETQRRSLFRQSRDLRAAHDAVRAAGQTKNEFIANLSHELRTPLNTIIGYTDLILDNDFGSLSDEMRAPVERVSKSADNLRALI